MPEGDAVSGSEYGSFGVQETTHLLREQRIATLRIYILIAINSSLGPM